MGAWRNATADPTVMGILRRDETTKQANLMRDHQVSAPLRPFVERYWSVRWDLRNRPPFRSEVLSHPSVNLSIETGDRPRFGADLPAALVHGIVTHRFVVDLEGWGRVTAAKFRPGGWTALTGRPTTRDTVDRLGDEVGLAPERLVSQVLAADEDGDRVAALDRALAPLARVPDPAYEDLRLVLGRMAGDRTLVRVDQVAAAAGVSVRALQRLFARYVGVPPKAVLARYRLQHAVEAMDAGEVEDLADLAASLGWFDQAHFARDFRDVVGRSPSDYVRQLTGG